MMAKVYNSNFYKLGKSLLKEAPKAIDTLTECYTKLEKFMMLSQVRLVMRQIDVAKQDLVFVVNAAKKVVDNKGKMDE